MLLLDILGYILMGIFGILGLLFLLWGAVVAISLPIAIIGTMFEDLKGLSKLFRR